MFRLPATIGGIAVQNQKSNMENQELKADGIRLPFGLSPVVQALMRLRMPVQYFASGGRV
jgi:hypothetical protein